MKINSEKYTGTSGVYVSAIPDKSSIDQIANSINPPFPLDEFLNEAHLTIMYSRNTTINPDDVMFHDEISAIPLKFEYWPGHDSSGYVVLKLVSSPANELHDRIVLAGGTHSFTDYTPHITIAHNFNNGDLDDIKKWVDEANKSIRTLGFLVRFVTINIENCKS